MLYPNQPYKIVGHFAKNKNFTIIKQNDKKFALYKLNTENNTFEQAHEVLDFDDNPKLIGIGPEITPIWDRPMTKEQIRRYMRDDGFITGNIIMHISDVIDNDLEGFLDIISKALVNTPCLEDINYTILGVTEPDNLLINVTGYIDI